MKCIYFEELLRLYIKKKKIEEENFSEGAVVGKQKQLLSHLWELASDDNSGIVAVPKSIWRTRIIEITRKVFLESKKCEVEFVREKKSFTYIILS